MVDAEVRRISICEIPRKELRISITTGCNMECVYCHNEGKAGAASMNIEMLKDIVKASLPYGLESVRITGEEPLIHRDLPKMCRMLKAEFKLKIGINTNGILADKLLSLIKDGYIDRVIVGLDFYAAPVSKDSPVGKPSGQILNHILAIKETGVNICVDVVYNSNNSNIEKIVEWGIRHHIRIKIIERVSAGASGRNEQYEQMKKLILERFSLEPKLDSLGETNGYIDDFCAVSFFHSFCRLRACRQCQSLPYRVTSAGVLKRCLFCDRYDIDLANGSAAQGISKAVTMDMRCGVE